MRDKYMYRYAATLPSGKVVFCSGDACGIVFSLLLWVLSAGVSFAEESMDAVILTAEDIATLQANKMPDVLNHVPGVSASSSSVSIHGSYKVKVFVDGRPMNDPTSAVGAVQWDLINPGDVEKIEVLLGKGAVKYGQDASGGVILITSARHQSLAGNVKIYGGNQQTGYANANLQVQQRVFSVGVSGGYETTGGYAVNDDGLRRRMGARFGYELGAEANAALSVDRVTDERGIAGYVDFPTPFARKSTELNNTSLRFVTPMLSSTSAYVVSRARNTDASVGLDRQIEVSEFSEQLSATYQSARLGSTSYGAGMVQSQASGNAFADQREHTWSVYVVQQLPKALLPVQLSVGLRANLNSAFADAYNPELKAAYSVSQWQLTGFYSGSNNTPSFQQRFNQTGTTRPNPQLNMERTRNYSLALRRSWGEQLELGFTLFRNRLADRITYVRDGSGIGQYQNLGRVSYNGGDLSASWQPVKALTMKGSYSYLEAKDMQTGYWLTGKARHSGSFSVQYRVRERLAMTLGGDYASSTYLDVLNTSKLPANWLFDVKAEYTLPRMTVFFEMNNALDKHYLYMDGYLAPPRSWFVGLSYKLL